MPTAGWKQLLEGFPWFAGEGKYPIAAYSEFMPPPRLVRKPYGTYVTPAVDEDDPWGLPVTEYEQAWQFGHGLARLAQRIVGALVDLAQGRRTRGIARHKLIDNPYWPPELAERSSSLEHERYVVLAPLALSRTQDDKGRVRWTLFGGSEQGPARAFWKGFFNGPSRELPAGWALDFLRRLLAAAYEEPLEKLEDLVEAGFRILDPRREAGPWDAGSLPSWTGPFLWDGSGSPRRVKYLLTFRRFGALPAAVRRAYLAGELHLLPCPGSLIFWGVPGYGTLQQQLPLAQQIALLHLIERAEDPHGVRVPQSGWLHEPGPRQLPAGAHGRRLRQMYQRTHRWNRTHRHQDELDVLDDEDKVAHVLFSTAPDELGLYDKPMARNSQIWTHDYQLLLDGPMATRADIKRAALHLAEGGLFGYRFQFPAMRVGLAELYWHRPLVAYLSPATGRPEVLPDAPLGYVTAYRADLPDPANAVELWPRLLQREVHRTGLELFAHEGPPYWINNNICKILDVFEVMGRKPLSYSLARQLIKIPKQETLDQWLAGLPDHAADSERGKWLVEQLHRCIGKASPAPGAADAPRPAAMRAAGKKEDRASKTKVLSSFFPAALTLEQTARRPFEVAYWKTIAFLAHGEFRNKDNADCVLDKVTQATLPHRQRDLEALGDYLIGQYRRAIEQAGVRGAWAGEHAFNWQTEYDFSWWGGWVNNQSGHAYERNIVMRIPGADPRQAIIMADHYDTAYMADCYDPKDGGSGARVAAAGADDNHSATAALMLAAPIFLELSKAGQLGCDIWLVHLTGEEFPADCLGARHLCQDIVQGTLKVRTAGDKVVDLSGVRIKGVYVSDMIAHNNDHDRDVFQIAPGQGRESAWLALQANLANGTWNDWARAGNRRPPRKGAGPGRRSKDAVTVPDLAEFAVLSGEVRPPLSPRSTLYNTDGQIFSDAGVPVVLFMENYDINRSGYHDSHDTMENIDLDYGAALAAIVIESVARAAQKSGRQKRGQDF
jgi:hypothetical protein